MRRILALAALGLACGVPAALEAQGAPPPGSYQRHCRDISMNGQNLHAWCRGTHGSGESTLNVLSCSTDISVDPEGGLICGGPGGGQPNYPAPDRPGYDRPGDDRAGYDRPPYDNRPYPGDRPRPPYDRPPYDDGYRPPYGGGGREPIATLYEGRRFRGPSIEVYGETSNLDRTGFNDRVGSIRFSRRSGPWQVCTDSKFRGRCTIVRGEVRDTGSIGMENAISSLRPY